MLWLVQRAFETLGVYESSNLTRKCFYLMIENWLIPMEDITLCGYLVHQTHNFTSHLDKYLQILNSFPHPGSLIQSKQ